LYRRVPGVTSYSVVETLPYDVSFSHNAQRHRQTADIIIQRAVRSAKTVHVALLQTWPSLRICRWNCRDDETEGIELPAIPTPPNIALCCKLFRGAEYTADVWLSSNGTEEQIPASPVETVRRLYRTATTWATY